MIRNGRPVLDRFEVGQVHGLTPAQATRQRPWAEPGHPAPVNQPGGRKGALWDAAQVRAHVAGEPIPPLPDEDAPDDLLDADEVGERAGIATKTVLRYIPLGTIIPAPDTTIHGQPHWRRQTIEEWLPNRPGPGAGGGRPNANGLSDTELMERAVKFHEEAVRQGRTLGIRELGRLLEVSPMKATKIRASLLSSTDAAAPNADDPAPEPDAETVESAGSRSTSAGPAQGSTPHG